MGDLIYKRVLTLTRPLLRTRDPRVYARGAHDFRDGLEDVVNDFVLTVLIEERQIDYVLGVATGIDDFDRLIRRQIRRFLARTRSRGIVDNLIDRAVQILRNPPFGVVGGSGPGEVYGRPKGPYGRGDIASDGEIAMAAALAQGIPKVTSKAEERAPKVYDAEGLLAALSILVDNVGGPVGRRNLQSFFDLLLTAWTLTFLDLAAEENIQDVSLSPEDETVISDLANRLSDAMSIEERTIFQYKYANLPDRQLAEKLGLSRQSTAPRKIALFDRLSAELNGLAPALQSAFLASLSVAIGKRGVAP